MNEKYRIGQYKVWMIFQTNKNCNLTTNTRTTIANDGRHYSGIVNGIKPNHLWVIGYCYANVTAVLHVFSCWLRLFKVEGDHLVVGVLVSQLLRSWFQSLDQFIYCSWAEYFISCCSDSFSCRNEFSLVEDGLCQAFSPLVHSIYTILQQSPRG